jgi:hypothetical protein
MLVLLLLAAATYGCEDLFLRYRISHNSGAPVLEQVPVYEAGEVKGGKLEFYFNQGESQMCVHGVFPHFGDAPCWYVKRHTMKRLSKNGAEAHSGRSSKVESISMELRKERYTGHFPANTPCTRWIVSRFSSAATIVNAT